MPFSADNPSHLLDVIKQVFEDNQKLKGDLERLFDNVEGSRQDLHKVSSSNKSAVQGIPTLISQQYMVAKNVYETQIEQL